ncbi:MAG: amidohydrolase [Planctomycetaceae bacterium]|nr:amidohydrolase [Planctomycetaceae bacterium]
MPRFRALWFVVSVLAVVAPSAICFGQKAALYESLRRREEPAWQAALQIWEWSEPGYQEQKSSALLARMLEEAGFRVEREVADIPTAFTATFGTEGPVIGILGEFDALPGLSQQAVPYRQPRDEGTWGHGCGHHLFGVASAAASMALAEQIRLGAIKGTVRFYGCPAEEGGSAKVFMARAGLFRDCDAVLHWHPSSRNAAGDMSSLARIAVKFRFRGKAAHAAGAPHLGRSALDAVEITNHAAELLREHTPDLTRIHHVITAGGDAPNIVPEFAEVYFYVRHPNAAVVQSVYRRLELCAEAGALASETKLEIDYQGGTVELLPNSALTQVTLSNLRALNGLEYSADERQFALRLQETLEEPQPLETVRSVTDLNGQVGKGSTDVGDVSWLVPTTGFSTACWVPGTAAHTWQACAAGATSLGRKGMNLAARVLAASAWDLYQQPQTLAAAKAELERRLGNLKYETLMRPGQKPPFDYRNPPKPGVATQPTTKTGS